MFDPVVAHGTFLSSNSMAKRCFVSCDGESHGGYTNLLPRQFHRLAQRALSPQAVLFRYIRVPTHLCQMFGF